MQAQVLLNGLLQGCLIGAVGVAFALVYHTTKVFHIALGAVFAFSPYALLGFLSIGLPAWAAMAATCTAMALLGALISDLVHQPLFRKRAPEAVHLIASLGTYTALVPVIALFWGHELRTLRTGASEVWKWGGAFVTPAQLFGALSVLLALAAFAIWLRKANRGLELRGLSDNPDLTALLGCNVCRLRRYAFGISGGLAGLAALAQAWDVGFDPHVGLDMVLLGMVAMIIGGQGSFFAPFIGGLMLGALRAEIAWFGSVRWEEAATFALLALFLFLRPQGIFAKRHRLEGS